MYRRTTKCTIWVWFIFQAGLDMAIVNAGAIPQYDEIPADLLKLCEDLIWNKSPNATEKMLVFAQVGKLKRNA